MIPIGITLFFTFKVVPPGIKTKMYH
jgi:hypothetical protein